MPRLMEMLATWFYVGRIWIAPGTWGAIASYPLYYTVMYFSDTPSSGAAILLRYVVPALVIIGYFSVRAYHKMIHVTDHKSIVIDEVAGQILTLSLAHSALNTAALEMAKHWPFWLERERLAEFVVALVFFRFFDIFKPFGIKFLERSMPNALGVMLDDIAAAVWAAVTIGITINLVKIL